MRNAIGGGLAVLIILFFLPLNSIAVNYFQPGVNYAPNAIIIVFQQDISPIEYAIESGVVNCGIPEVNRLNERFGVSYIWPLFPKAKEHGQLSMAGYYSITFDESIDLQEVLTAFDKLAVVVKVEPVGVHKVSFIPNDSFLGIQWGISKINCYGAWNISQGDQSIVLGIPDTGVDWDHPDLNDDIWTNQQEVDGTTGVDDDGNGYVDDYRGWDWVTGVNGAPGEDDQTPDNNPMDFDGHGTHVSGIAGAETNNSIGIAGVGFDCRIMALRIGWRAPSGFAYVRMDFAASAFYYATNKGVKALNCSWESSSAIGAAASYAISNGVNIVKAAGNEGNSSADYLDAISAVIAVAATDASDHRATWSNYGSWVDVCAPGVSIYSTFFNNTYTYLDGTSMAAPFVTGLVGLVYAADPSLTSTQVRNLIIDNADNIDALNPGYAGLLGSGRINAYQTLLQIQGVIDVPVPVYPIGSEYVGDPYPEFIWESSGSATVYHLLLGQSPLFGGPLVNDSTISDTTFICPDSLDSDGTWYWKIRAGNGGSWSDFSAVQYFQLDNTPPSNPALIAPGDIWISDPRPQFQWQSSTDSGSGIDKYILQIDTDTGFTSPLTLEDSTTNITFTPSFDLPSDNRYFWRVLALDNAGNIAYSDTGTFGIDYSPPDPPIDFGIAPEGWSNDPNFTVSWTNPSDSSGVANAFYKLGSAPTSNYDTSGHFSGSPAYIVAESTAVYYIFVWLIDGLGNVSYLNSASDSMFYDGSPPFGCEASSLPITSALFFTVSWSAGADTGSGISGVYDIQYKDGESGEWNDWIIGFMGLDSTFNGEDGHIYYFEARSHDIAGNLEPFSGIAETQTEVDTGYSGPEFIPGDANNSGSVNGLDVIYLVSYLKGQAPPPDPYLAGDANGSCAVNGLDVIFLVNYLKGGDPPFAGNCD